MIHTTSIEIAGRQLTIETGKLANQAGGSVTVRYGDSILLVTACASPNAREGIDFLPLTIDYEERLYAAGKIPGSFFRREGRPTTEATLAARLTDRPLRPRFPKGMRNEVQVISTIHAGTTVTGNTTQSRLDAGWTGMGHNLDIADGFWGMVDLACNQDCDNCGVTMNPMRELPQGFCRCVDDPTIHCSTIA